MKQLSLSLFGTFQASLDAIQLTGFRSDKTRALLVYLALEADRPHFRRQLAGLLWPEWPESMALSYVRQALNNLRHLLQDRERVLPFILSTNEALQFNSASSYWLDIATFQSKVFAANASTSHLLKNETVEQLQQAVALYRGPFLEGFSLKDSYAFEEWLLLKREQFHRQILSVLDRLIKHYETLEEFEHAHQYAWRCVELEPTLEEAHYQLMRLLAQTGQRSAALNQFEKCRKILAAELGVEPSSELTTLYEQIRSEKIKPTAKSAWQAKDSAKQSADTLSPILLSNLPTPSAHLIGRESELVEIAMRLQNSECRLLTLLGPGGIGKTRLALEIASHQAKHFTHGVYFVSLASVDTAHQIPFAIMEALQTQFYGDTEISLQLLNYLHEKNLLLILDNFEHLLPNVELLIEILKSATRVKLLVTSRERLKLREEWLLPLEGLGVPTEAVVKKCIQEKALTKLEEYSGIQLFLRSARRIQPEFSLTTENVIDITRICYYVSGMPLGIELAAGWLRVITCKQIWIEVQANIDFLTSTLHDLPERHRSMKAVFEHSWRLLSLQEQLVLQQLAVFRGGFRREAAEKVVNAPLNILLTLVDKSLIQVDNAARYQVHELLLQFSAAKLDEAKQAEQEVHERHKRYYIEFLLQRIDFPKGHARREDLFEVATEMGNVRIAWEWTIRTKDIESIERLTPVFWYFADFRLWHQEAYELFAQAILMIRQELQEIDTDQQTLNKLKFSKVLDKLLFMQGWMCMRRGQIEYTKLLAEENIARLQVAKHSSPDALPWYLYLLAWVLKEQGNYHEAREISQQSLNLFQAKKDYWATGLSASLLGTIAYIAGQPAEAEQFFQNSIRDWRVYGVHPGPLAFAIQALADVARIQGRYEQARQLSEECLEMLTELGYDVGRTFSLTGLGHIARAEKKWAEAQHYYQDALSIATEAGLQTIIETCRYSLGWISYECAQYDEAKQYFKSNLLIQRKNNQDSTGVAATLKGLAAVACAQKQYTEARAYIKQALQLLKQGGALPLILDVLVEQAHILLNQGEAEQAIEILTLVRNHVATKHATKGKAIYLLSIFAVVEERSEIKHIEQVIESILVR